MPIFNCFLKIVWKHKIGILIYITIFAALLFIISKQYSSQEAELINNMTNSDVSIPITVIDRDKSQLSQALTDYMDRRHDLVDLADDTEILQDSLFYRDVEYILFISEGFEKKLINGSDDDLLENVKLSGSTSGIYIDNQIARYILTVKAYLSAGYEIADTAAFTASDLTSDTDIEIYTEKADKPAESGFYFQYLAYILMAVIITAIGPVLIAFNQRDLARRIEVSSLKLRECNTQLAIGCILFSLAIWSLFIIIAICVYGSEMFSVVSALRIINIFIYLAVCISVAFLLGQFMKTNNALDAVTNAVSLGMGFLCGIFVPQEWLGLGVLSVAKFLPAYWYIRNNDMLLYITELSVSDGKAYMEALIIQIGFAIAVFAVALAVSKQKKINSII